jgi:hypothetical protein
VIKYMITVLKTVAVIDIRRVRADIITYMLSNPELICNFDSASLDRFTSATTVLRVAIWRISFAEVIAPTVKFFALRKHTSSLTRQVLSIITGFDDDSLWTGRNSSDRRGWSQPGISSSWAPGDWSHWRSICHRS